MAAQSQGPPYVACPQCTRHCRQVHGRGFSPCFHTPSFYLLLPAVFSYALPSLPIPPAFLGGRNIRIHQTSTPGALMYSEMQLEGPSGKKWPVVMQGTSLSDLAFTTGWGRFIEDHSIVAGDLLIFELLSRGSFSVSIYGSNGCEKAEAFAVQDGEDRSVQNVQSFRKRPANDDAIPNACMDAESKRRKVDAMEQFSPIIIDIDDDDDEENEAKECTSKPRSGAADQMAGSNGDAPILHGGGILESMDPCILVESKDKEAISKLQLGSNGDQTVGVNGNLPVVYGDIVDSRDIRMRSACRVDIKDDKSSQLTLIDLPPTPSNADKGSLAIRMQTQVILNCKVDGPADQQGPGHHSCKIDSSKGEANSSEEEDVVLDNYKQKRIKDEEMSSESNSVSEDCEDPPYCTDEATQRDRMKDALAREYSTEAFISKRRPVSAEERQRALQAAKQFKSSRPYVRKLMKESHVYRGFWMSLSSDFASTYLPQEMQEATLLDSSEKVWSARWLGKRSGLSGGWRKFSLDHGLEEGDICIFELIDRKKLVIKVHIFRVIELKNALPGRDHYLHKPASKPFLEYSCREPSTSAKKMRGAITYGRTDYSSPSTASSRFDEQWKEGLFEYKKKKLKGAVKASKVAIKFSAGAGKICRTNGTNGGQCSNGERSLQRNVEDMSAEREEKALTVCNTAEYSCSLQTPPKIREPIPDSLRVRNSVALAKQLDSRASRSQSGSSLIKDNFYDAKLNSCKKYYTVDRLFNRRKGIVEDEFLVELDIDDPLDCTSSEVTRDGSGWWVPLSHFTKDKTSCYL